MKPQQLNDLAMMVGFYSRRLWPCGVATLLGTPHALATQVSRIDIPVERAFRFNKPRKESLSNDSLVKRNIWGRIQKLYQPKSVRNDNHKIIAYGFNYASNTAKLFAIQYLHYDALRL